MREAQDDTGGKNRIILVKKNSPGTENVHEHRFECAVGGVRHPQHTQTGSNSSTIAADSSNGVTNTRCCRYSCLRS